MKEVKYKDFILTEHDLYEIYVRPILDPLCDEQSKKRILLSIIRARMDGFNKGVERGKELERLRLVNYFESDRIKKIQGD